MFVRASDKDSIDAFCDGTGYSKFACLLSRISSRGDRHDLSIFIDYHVRADR